jgi:hypothetical protein
MGTLLCWHATVNKKSLIERCASPIWKEPLGDNVIGGKLAILKDIHQILEVTQAAQHSSHQTANRRGADD